MIAALAQPDTVDLTPRPVSRRNRLVTFDKKPDGGFRANTHFHPGQQKAWDSYKNVVAVFAGVQSGKTSFLPWWLLREVLNEGPGDYLAVTANFPLFQNKFLPELLDVFCHTRSLGKYWPAAQIIELFDQEEDPKKRVPPAATSTGHMWGRILLASASAASRLASSTAKGAILDEAGLPEYTQTVWDEIESRCAIHNGRKCIGTTVYDLGWMKAAIYDPWSAAVRRGQDHSEIDVIQFDSTENPVFRPEFFEQKRKEMPRWKFDMRYRGLFSRPAGAIYDCFDRDTHVIKPRRIPKEWKRYCGLDFGGVHTAALFFAEDPDSHTDPLQRTLYLYREYLAGNRSAAEHVRHILRGEPREPITFGGSLSEGQWRREFRVAGLNVREPQKDLKNVEVGIDRVYAALKQHKRMRIFDTCTATIEDLQNYSRKLDDLGEPEEDIKDKNKFHCADAARYILGSMKKAQWSPVGYPNGSPF